MRLSVLLLLVRLALGQTYAPTPRADALFDKQDWAGAAREFKQVTEQNPQDGRAWFRLGSALHRTGNYRESATAFQRAAELQFQTGIAMSGVAREYAAQNQPDQALEWLDKAAKAGFANPAPVPQDPNLAALNARPEFAGIWARIRANASACSVQPEYDQFDFWLGEWDVAVGGQTVGHSRIEKISNGCIVQENWMPFNGGGGKSWNFYNTATGKWEQLWLSGGSVLKVEGQLSAGGVMAFLGSSVQPGAPEAKVRLSFTPLANGTIRQLYERSTDSGKTWTTSFDGIYTRRKEETISRAERQELLDHLKHSQQVFADAIREVSPAQARFKPSPESWSILECAEHLAQAEQLLFADVIDGLKLPTGGRSTVTKEQILEAWGTSKVKAKSSGDYDPAGRWPDLSAVQKIFDERRAKTMDFVGHTEADLHGRICCGTLDMWQQLLGISAHTLRHVDQMNRVKADPGYPKQG